MAPQTAEMLALLAPTGGEASEIVVAVNPGQYTASALARAVEDCDANLLNLNVLPHHTPADELVVALRIDHRSPSAAVRSLERYGLRVIAVVGSGAAPSRPADGDDVTRERLESLMRFLNV